MAYVNRKTKKIFSVEAVEDNPADWLQQRIAEANDSGDWEFFFSEPPSPGVVRGFLAELG